MLYKRLHEFANKKGWRVEKNIAYGEEDGYLFTIIDGQGFKAFISPLILDNDEVATREILDYLNDNKKNYKKQEFSIQDNLLEIKLLETFKNVKLEVMEELVKNLSAFLKAKGVKGKGYCGICGKEGAEEIIYLNKLMLSAHGECYRREAGILEEAAVIFDTEEKNYLLGFVGAFLGGLISTLPWILVQLFLNRIMAALAVIIGMGALKGYQIFKGRLGPFTRWIITITTMASVVIAQYVTLAVEIAKNNIPLTYENYMLIMEIPEVARSFKADLFMSLFMALLGILALFFRLKGNSKTILPSISKNS